MDALTDSLRMHDESLRIRTRVHDGSGDISLDGFRRIVSRWNRCVSDDPPGPLFRGVVTPHNVRMMAQHAAEIVQTVLHHFPRQPEARADIAEAEAAFEDILALLRSGARNQSRELIALGFEALAGSVVDAAAEALVETDESSSPDTALAAIRAHHLMHRIVATVAAIPGLQLRQLESRSRSSLARVAARRLELRMPGLPSLEDVITRLADRSSQDRVAFLGYAEDATWIERPERPYTRIRMANGEELRVHFKNARREGVTGRQWVWARCKVEEPEDDLHYAVAEFEGPTTSAGECWESWLHVEARDHYDITPASLHLYTSDSEPELDLYARLAPDEEVA